MLEISQNFTRSQAKSKKLASRVYLLTNCDTLPHPKGDFLLLQICGSDKVSKSNSWRESLLGPLDLNHQDFSWIRGDFGTEI